MNRLSVRLIVFVGLLAAAGAIWGVLECSMFTWNFYALIDGPKSNAAFAYPIAIILVLFTAWLAVYTVLRNGWNTARTMGWLSIPFGPAMFSLMIVPSIVIMDHFITVTATIVGVVLSVIVLLAAVAVHDRRIRRERPTETVPNWRQIVPPIALTTIAYLLYLIYVGRGEGDPDVFLMSAFGGFAIPTAWMFSALTDLSLTSWFASSLIAGGIVGAWMGSFMAEFRAEVTSLRRQLRFMLVTGVIVAVVSGLMFLAHAFLLMKSYSVGWNGEMLRPTAVTVWGVLGAVVGLMLALAVHILSAREIPVRYRRLGASLAVVAPMILIPASWTWSTVCAEGDALRILQQSVRQYGHSADIGFGYGKSLNGPRQIIVPNADKAVPRLLCDDYRRTADACDRMLAQYPKSAFRSAALFLKTDACRDAWQTEEAIRTYRLLRKAFPHHRYDWSHWGPVNHMADLMLIGDYEGVLDTARSTTGIELRTTRNGLEALADERLGRWEEAVEARRALLASLAKNKPKHPSAESLQSIERARARLRHAESMLAKKAGAHPTTDVIGRVRLNAQPLAGTVVCLIPSDRMHADDTTISAYSAGMRGGRIARTDAGGRFTISGLVSGEYAVMVVADPDLVPKTVTVNAPGVPYRIAGKRAAIPEIRLTIPLSR